MVKTKVEIKLKNNKIINKLIKITLTNIFYIITIINKNLEQFELIQYLADFSDLRST